LDSWFIVAVLCFSVHEISKQSLLAQYHFFILLLLRSEKLLIHVFSTDKPSPEDLQYFLEFQIPRQWAPMFCELPLRHQRRKTSSLSLQFCCLGPKLHISSTEVLLAKLSCLGKQAFRFHVLNCTVLLVVSYVWVYYLLWQDYLLISVKIFSAYVWLAI
jgi:hypothetical protein